MPVALNRRARVLLPIFLVVLVGFSVQRLMQPADGAPSAAEASTTRIAGTTMGTTYSVVVAPPYPTDMPTKEVLTARVQAELDRLSGLMSTWEDASELMRFNRAKAGVPFALSPDTRRVMTVGQQVSERTGGAFDMTVAPLVRLWGFGAKPGEQSPPSEDALREARAAVDYRKLTLVENGGIRGSEALTVDLSAVAKGDAVDQVSKLLTRAGYVNHLVEIGGEMRASGTKPKGAWRAGIELPDALTRTVRRVVELRDLAIATSGDYRNFYERDGKRYSHTIDPRAGKPVEHSLASVSVLHEQCGVADAWATALNVLGPVEGMLVAERNRVAALFLVRTGEDEFESRSTQRFVALTQSIE